MPRLPAHLAPAIRLILIALLASTQVGCSLYTSSARDDFNVNGKSRAPLSASQSTSFSYEDRELLANPCSPFENLTPRELESLFGTHQLGFETQLSPKTSTCIVKSDAGRALEHVSIMTCSWKPSSGRAIQKTVVSDSGQPLQQRNRQSTESDFRDMGFGVLATRIKRGASLRLNCEAYVEAVSLTDAIENPRDAHVLVSRFHAFTEWLTRQTLTSSTQR